MEINWNTVITAGFTLLATVVGLIVSSRLRLREARSIRVQERQAEVIDELYGLLLNVHEAARHVLTPMPTPPQIHKENRPGFLDAWDALYRFFSRRRLYFDAQVCGDMEALHRRFTDADVNAGAWHDKERFPYEDRLKTAQSNEAIRKDIDNICRRLQEQFRKLLGTHS